MKGISPLPTDDILVRKTLRGIMRKKLAAPSQKMAITADLIKVMADLTDDSPIGIRDRALLLIGFAGAFRRSELTAIRVEDIEVNEKGMTIFIPQSKTDQLGEGQKKPILRGESHCPVEALQAWLSLINISEGYVFKRLSKSGNVHSLNSSGKPDLGDKTVVNIIKKYAAMVGLEPGDFSGHSLRRGFITSSLLAGASIAKTMKVTGQKDPKTLLRYFEDINKFDDHAAEGLL
jgi:integrase